MLDSESKYASTCSDSMIERTLQLTRSSISFHISEGTILSPAGAVATGREDEDSLNHTSRSFSGPEISQLGSFTV